MSLRKVSNGRVEPRGIFFRKWFFHTTKTNYFVLYSGAYEQALAERETTGVAEIGRDGGRVLWWAESGLYWADRELAGEDVALLIWDRQRRQDSKLSRLRTIHEQREGLVARQQGEMAAAVSRQGVPIHVRTHVWRRDSGRCQKCGSRSDVQFDQVIPISKGGDNSAKNIQLLCSDCFRTRANSVSSAAGPATARTASVRAKRLKGNSVADGTKITAARRQRIPADVRAWVWERDEERCVNCGSGNDLQLDHIIPVSKGGGNAAENIQILCGDCNRQKGDSIIE